MSNLPVQFLLLTIADWMTRDHQRVIEYLITENAVLREHLSNRRLRFTDPQRCRLAHAANKLGRKALAKFDTLVTPDTLLRWYRTLVASKYDGSARRACSQPRRTSVIVQLVLRIASENPTWGYTRIRGALSNLGHDIGRNTIKRILIEAWMKQVARNLSDAVDGFLLNHRYIIMDRDPLYTSAFRQTLRSSGVRSVRLPPRSPNLNAYAERFVGSVRRECLDRVVPLERATCVTSSMNTSFTIMPREIIRRLATN